MSVSQLENDVGYLTAHQPLSDYYTKSETSSASQLSDALSSKAELSDLQELQDSISTKIFIDDRISGISGFSDLNIIRLSAAEYD